jgi:integrase
MLTRQGCLAWYRGYRQDFSTSRSNAALGILNIILEIAIGQRRRLDNPDRVLKRQSPYASDEDRRVARNELPADEQLAHIRQCLEIDESENAVRFKPLLNTGCRVESAGNILWKHIDWDRGEVLIAKAKRGPYRIPLFPPLRLLLENLIVSRGEMLPDSPVIGIRSIKNRWSGRPEAP